jgi:predicted aspartyl protease
MLLRYLHTIVVAAILLIALEQASLAQSYQPTPIQRQCSEEATALGLHGLERKNFRTQCKQNAARPPDSVHTAPSNQTVATPLAAQQEIKMEESGGVYVVPVRFNDTITLDAIVDSGASDVNIPADIVLTLMRTKTVTDQDFLGNQTYILADGSRVPSQQFRIRSLKVGNKTVQNVVASIGSVNGEILLGQSFLSKFKSWSVDNEQHVLLLR